MRVGAVGDQQAHRREVPAGDGVVQPAVASAATSLVSVFPYTPVDTFDICADTTDGRFDVES